MAPTSPALPGSAADAFLHVQTRRAGKIKGEAVASGHADDIEVIGWQWGVSANSALGGKAATARRSYTALTVVKRVDAATAGLLSALAGNDDVKEARLTLRRAGGEQEDFFSIKLQDARIASLAHRGDSEGNTEETLTIAFTKVELSYQPQKASGQRGGACTFQDELPGAG
ncbi:hypothetical protein CLD22_14660 [Rubrivivax gelatinosus]|nr:hypothetical protein [Rubrivivax gelatinosus]